MYTGAREGRGFGGCWSGGSEAEGPACVLLPESDRCVFPLRTHSVEVGRALVVFGCPWCRVVSTRLKSASAVCSGATQRGGGARAVLQVPQVRDCLPWANRGLSGLSGGVCVEESNDDSLGQPRVSLRYCPAPDVELVQPCRPQDIGERDQLHRPLHGGSARSAPRSPSPSSLFLGAGMCTPPSS